MGSMQRKLARSVAKKNPSPRTNEDRVADIISEAMNSPELAALARAAARLGRGASTMDVVIPVVHVGQPEWLAHFGIRPGDGASVLAQEGYLSGPAFHWTQVASASDRLARLLEMERRDGRRVRPDKQTLLAIVHEDGEMEAAWIEMAGFEDGPRASEAFEPEPHLGAS